MATSCLSRSIDRPQISDHRDLHNQVVEMGTDNHEEDRKKATGLRKALGTVSQPSSQPTTANANFLTTKQQLLVLEKLGAVPTLAADEVRNIIADGIADKFGEIYRTFPLLATDPSSFLSPP